MAEQPKQILRFKNVCAKVGLGRTAVREKIKRGEFPAGYPIGARAVGFLESDIDAWIDSRVKAVGGSI